MFSGIKAILLSALALIVLIPAMQFSLGGSANAAEADTPSTQVTSTITVDPGQAVEVGGQPAVDRQEAPWATESTPVVSKRIAPIVAAVVVLILRLGYYVVRYLPQVLQVFNNYLLKREACAELRRRGSPWGWSFICWGT